MQASSIGIIGGADGPTAVYTASKSPVIIIIAVVLGVSAVVAVLLFKKRR